MRKVSLLLTLVVIAVAAPLRAAPNWTKLIPLTRVEADPEKTYDLTEENGPWVIFVTSFAGEGAEGDAQKLVLELRKDFGLHAFTHKRRFDFTQPEQGLGLTKEGQPRMMKHQNDIAFDEIAVMVGDYPSWDDPKAQRILKDLKAAKPRSMAVRRPNENDGTSGIFSTLRETQRDLFQLRQALSRNRQSQPEQPGPLAHAMLTPNPLLPLEQFKGGGLDPFVAGMNKDVEYSLLGCPSRYSVRVATFRGKVVLDQQKVEQIENGEPFESHLDEAADKAHRLTIALRRQGVEAYEFHDRYESIVTVGNFESIGTPRPDGRIELDPAIHQVMKNYGPETKGLVDGKGRELAGLQPRKLGDIYFDVQPIPVEVPRQSIGQAYARSGGLFR